MSWCHNKCCYVNNGLHMYYAHYASCAFGITVSSSDSAAFMHSISVLSAGLLHHYSGTDSLFGKSLF